MSNLPGIKILASSPLWEQSVEKIHAVQLHALLRRYAEKNQRDIAETAIEICLNEVKRAVKDHEIPTPRMLDFTVPIRHRMTKRELQRGLALMGARKAAAVLFALEMGMDAKAVGYLTWTKAMRMFKAATLTSVAIACTKICPRQMCLQYVFWQDDESGQPKPFFSLDADIYDAFGLVWAELETAYSRLL